MELKFFNENWFWTGLFTLLGSLSGILGNIFRESVAARSKTKLERLKLYESSIIKAHDDIIKFVSYASNSWPPSDLRTEYTALIRSEFFKKMKDNKIFYTKQVRDIISIFADQYNILNEDTAMIDKFYKEEFLNNLEKLEKLALERIDEILHEDKGKFWTNLKEKISSLFMTFIGLIEKWKTKNG